MPEDARRCPKEAKEASDQAVICRRFPKGPLGAWLALSQKGLDATLTYHICVDSWPLGAVRSCSELLREVLYKA